MSAMVQAMVANEQTTIDLVWAMEWLESLTNDLNGERWHRNGDNEHPRTREFLDDLAARRRQSEPLHLAAQEAQL